MTAVDLPAVPRTQDAGRSYRRDFGQLLDDLRIRNGLSVRALADRANYSHTRIVRAVSDDKRPPWPLTEGYLRGCGVAGAALAHWRELWTVMDSAENAATPPSKWLFWYQLEQRWYDALSAILQMESLPARIASSTELGEIMAVVKLLIERSGEGWTRRTIEARTGISRSMLQRWFAGEAEPDPARFEVLVRLLGATPAEQSAFDAALRRVLGPRCGAPHSREMAWCIRNEYHRGRHKAANELTWLDDGELDETTEEPEVYKHLRKHDQPRPRSITPDW